ncbi:glycine-rich domain-containing protein [Azospirillum picis]|uniref:glycine-rich domain-containing protein n=1 Tax=Azospirillum picis TaxID=488438 RepID=UPI003520C2E5
MSIRDPLGSRLSVRRRFVGSTFFCSTSLTGTISCPVPAGVDSCDIIAVGGGGGCWGGRGGSAGGMAIRRNKAVVPGQIIPGTIGQGSAAQTEPDVKAGSTTVDGMTAEGGLGCTTYGLGGAAYGGDINLNGGMTFNGNGGGLPSPAWIVTDPAATFNDSGGPYIHPSFKGRSGGPPELPGAGARYASFNSAGANGGIFFFWYVTEAV